MLLENHLVIVNPVGNEVPRIYYKKLCVFMFLCFKSGYEEEVTEECFIVLTFLSSVIHTLITQTHSHNFSALTNTECPWVL